MVMPFATGLAVAAAALGVLPSLSAMGAPAGPAQASVRSQEWWLASLHVTQAWPSSTGAGVTVAVLSTGVDPIDEDLAGDVTTGPDFTGSGRSPGSPYWGFEGTAVAALIAGHGHGAGDRSGIIGIAPAARILSLRVTLEFNDPLASDASITRRLPQAIADGITYAVAHGARIIDLPLDPGTLGLTGQGDPAAAGGSPAEQAAVEYALAKNVVLVAPAGDDGMGPGIVNYPAAYPGVIAVGAVSRGGQLASFSSRRSYVSLTAPGVALQVPDLADGYQATSSTSAASGIVAGIAALLVSRFPHLTVAQVTQALIESTATSTTGASLPPLPAKSPDGAGYGTVDAARAMEMATLITTPRRPAVRPVRPRQPARRPVAVPRRPAASTLAGTVLRAALAGVCALIVLLVVTLLVMRSRRERERSAPPGHTRARGLHERAGPEDVRPVHAPGPGHGVRGRPQATRSSAPPVDRWPSPGGWQGGGIGEIHRSAAAPFGPAVPAPPRVTAGYRSGRTAGADGKTAGPPWAPAPEPEPTTGPLPVVSAGLALPAPGPALRVPGDMAMPPTGTGESAVQHPLAGLETPAPPAGFAATAAVPDFGPALPAFDLGPPQATAFPPRESLDFAAAPVAADHPAAFPAAPAAAGGPGPDAADPSYIWDLAATDVFPAVPGGERPAETDTTQTAPAPDAPPPPEGGSGGGN
jgi:hypothetical protein